jgi:N-acyl-phosphatidylethanolamine-hydrolysing phospholipase D
MAKEYTAVMFKTLWSFIKWQFRLRQSEKNNDRPYAPEYAQPNLEKINNPDPAKIQLTWIGHSTFLIQFAGLNILTDPIWSERASPVQWAGPKRFARAGLRFDHLPKIDVVLISHTHYDHLDRNTILRLGNAPHYILPENLGEWFRKRGIDTVTELSWWNTTQIGALKITAVPAKHWSKRRVFGTEDHGWGGYVIETPAGTVYFVGDTGYHCEYFKEIGKRVPNIDLALVPIGAYYPRTIFGSFHIDPHEAVVIHTEVGAKRSIGMHWGTFKLTQEPLDEPPLELARQLSAIGVPQERFSVMKIGETAEF